MGVQTSGVSLGVGSDGVTNGAAGSRAAGDGGEPAELLSGFTATATRWAHETRDPDVSKAFLLGWRIGIALDWAASGAHVAWPDDDPGLDGDSRWGVLKGQIESAGRELTSGAGDSFPLPALGDAPPLSQSVAVLGYQQALSRRLYVTGQFRGLAFFLGCNLEGACAGTRRLVPTDQMVPDQTARTAGRSGQGGEPAVGPVTGTDELAADIPALKKAMLGLATKLPPNAAHSVINSLTLWEEQLTRKELAFDSVLLRKQGGVWRSILSGDVAAKDLLCLSDYIGTGEQVASQLKYLARRTVRSHLLVPVAGVLVLAVAGFVLLLFSRTAAAGAGALLAALGLTWKGVGQYLGKAAAGVEQSLWDAQLDWTIAYRTTMSVVEGAVPASRKERKGMPPAELQRADHFDTWQRWKAQWPAFELEP